MFNRIHASGRLAYLVSFQAGILIFSSDFFYNFDLMEGIRTIVWDCVESQLTGVHVALTWKPPNLKGCCSIGRLQMFRLKPNYCKIFMFLPSPK